MRPVIKATLKQAVFINVVFFLLIVAGVYSLSTIPVEQYPPVDFGKVMVDTVYYGASAEDVERLVTDKFEDALDGMEGIEFISATSMRNKSSLVVKFIDDTDYRALYDELRFRILNIRSELPAGVDEPFFTFLTTQDWISVVVVNLVGELPNHTLKRLSEELKARFKAISGVQSVTIIGAYQQEFQVSLDPARLRRLGVTFREAAEALRLANVKAPTGSFSNGNKEFVLEAGHRFSTQEAVLAQIVRQDGEGNFIRIRDLVTQARLSHRDPETIASVNGETAIQIFVSKEDAGNTLHIASEVKAITAAFQRQHAQDGVKLVITQDSTVELTDSLRTLGGNLLLGMILVTLALWLTLGLRTALLTAIGIPFSFLGALIIMNLSAQSINVISLLAAILVSGIIVDDAIIIMENVDRHRRLGKSLYQAVVDGTAEIFLPVTSAALTTVIAFLPMMLMTGSTGDFFANIPKSVTFMLIVSLFEVLFILPVHILEIGDGKKGRSATVSSKAGASPDPFVHLEKSQFALAWRGYHRLLHLLLRNKWKVVGGVTGLFALAMTILVLSILGIAPLIKVQFFPGNYSKYHVGIEMPAGTSLAATDNVVKTLANFLEGLGPEMTQAAEGRAGMSQTEDYVRNYSHNLGQVVVTLPDRASRHFPDNPANDPMLFLEYVRQALQDFIKQQYADEVMPVLKVFEEADGPPVGKPVNIRVSAIALTDALPVVDELMHYLQSDQAFTDLVELTDDRPTAATFAVYEPKQEAISEQGLASGDVAQLIAGAMQGHYAGQYRTDEEEIDLMVRLARAGDAGNFAQQGLKRPEDILALPVLEDSDAPIYLGDLVNLQYRKEADSLKRYNGYPTVSITAGIKVGSQLSAGRVQQLVKRHLEQILPAHSGVQVSFAGEFADTQRAYSALSFAFIIAVLGIYLVLASQFRDYFQPVIILSAIAFALIGVVFGMFFTGSTFTVRSFIAVVGLAGIVVNDTLILVDFMNVVYRAGRPLREAVIEGCSMRMRPVLITTITTTLGMLPMAVGFPEKSITWAPMATTFVTGLTASTLLALLVVPVLYELLEELRSGSISKKGE